MGIVNLLRCENDFVVSRLLFAPMIFRRGSLAGDCAVCVWALLASRVGKALCR